MNLISFDNVLKDCDCYVEDIIAHGFQEIASGDMTFHNVQPRDAKDEFAEYITSMFPGYNIKWNIVKKSDKSILPNRLNYDGMSGDITAVLFLNDLYAEDRLIILDENKEFLCTAFSKKNRMIAFDSDASIEWDILECHEKSKKEKIIQIIFLEEKK